MQFCIYVYIYLTIIYIYIYIYIYIFIYIYIYIYIYTTQEQPDGRETQRRVCGKGLKLPCSLQHHSSGTSICSSTQKTPQSCNLRILIKVSSSRHDQSLTQFPDSVQRMWVGPKVLCFWSWLCLSGHQPHPAVHQESPH